MKNMIIVAALTIVVMLLVQNGNATVIRKWTGHCTIALQGSQKTYVPQSWQMSVGGPLTDRQKKTKEYIESTWLNNGAIWKLLGMNNQEQDSWCRKGGGTFRIDYGFDERQKEWNFTKYVPVTCVCSGDMIFK
jgi:hypothetical protein